MNTTILNLLFNLHALILLSFIMSCVLYFLIRQNFIKMSAAVELRFNHILIFLVLILPLVAIQLSDRFHFKPIAKTYTAINYREYDKLKVKQKAETEQIALTNSEDPFTVSMDTIKWAALLILFGSMIFSARQVLLDYRKLHHLTRNTYLYRKHKRLRIVFSEEVRVPFSFKTLTKAWVVVPLKFTMDPKLLKLSILHELQHHRQKDTQWVYLFQFMKALAGLNPALHQWLKIIFEVQEFKVDEALIDHGKVRRQEYASSLIEVAESVSQIEKPLVCATGLAFLPKRHELTRRIEFMYKNNRTSRFGMAFIAVLITASMTAVAFTTSKAIDTRALTMADAERMAKHASKSTSFPIAMNELVLEQLNRYLGTQQGRDFMKQALARMETYRPMIERKLLEYNAPSELMAIPIVESGYQNLPPSANPYRAAGLWQFIETTADYFQLHDRQDPEQATDAAMRYLLSNRLLFKSWELSIIAYNAGEKRVREGIRKTGSDDAWTLVRKGYEGDKAYLARVIAAILIMKNPSSLN